MTFYKLPDTDVTVEYSKDDRVIRIAGWEYAPDVAWVDGVLEVWGE